MAYYDPWRAECIKIVQHTAFRGYIIAWMVDTCNKVAFLHKGFRTGLHGVPCS